MRNDTNLGKTLQTLFSSCDPDGLAQLYFNIETPNIDACATYWQVTEYALIKSILGVISNKCGHRTYPDFSRKQPEKMPDGLKRKARSFSMMLGREALWRLSHWKNKNFLFWADDFQPEHIFAILSDSGERADTVRWLANRYHCPVTLFVTDDYYHDETNSSVWLRKAFFRDKQKRIERMATQCCDRVIGCSEVAAQEFGELFHVPYETIFTPSRKDLLALPLREQKSRTCVTFRYFGNLGLERWRSLKLLGETIRKINVAAGKKRAFLEVYSPFTDESITNELNIENGAAFMGFVSGDTFTELLASADVAVHVESFLPDMIRRTRLSISTKIADYLGAGKCILAIGPKEVASMQHISGVAETVYAPENLKETVGNLVSSGDVRTQRQLDARKLAAEQHSMDHITQQVRSLFEA